MAKKKMSDELERNPYLPPDEGGAPTDDSAPPPFATPTVADPTAPLPRVIKQIERAPTGMIRFKISGRSHGVDVTRYILAQSEDQARSHFMEITGLSKLMAKARKASKDGEIEEPELAVTRLSD